MKKFAIAMIMVLSLLALNAAAAEWTGWISDAKCGVKGAKAEHAGCAQGCVKGGQAPVFVVGDKVLKIDDAKKVADHIGHNVTISGKLEGDTVHIDSVKMAK